MTDSTNPGIFARDIALPLTSEGRVEVTFGMELAYELRDSETFITEVPIEGLRITVINQVPDLIGPVSVDMIHRCVDAVHSSPETWIFDRALLPGHGFGISWWGAMPFLQGNQPIREATLAESNIRTIRFT